MGKFCLILKIKKKYVKKYIAEHKNMASDLLKIIKDSGILDEHIYFYNNMAIVHIESMDLSISDALLKNDPVYKEFIIRMKPLLKKARVMPVKVFDLNEQIYNSVETE